MIVVPNSVRYPPAPSIRLGAIPFGPAGGDTVLCGRAHIRGIRMQSFCCACALFASIYCRQNWRTIRECCYLSIRGTQKRRQFRRPDSTPAVGEGQPERSPLPSSSIGAPPNITIVTASKAFCRQEARSDPARLVGPHDGGQVSAPKTLNVKNQFQTQARSRTPILRRHFKTHSPPISFATKPFRRALDTSAALRSADWSDSCRAVGQIHHD
jgi:hypothetical protein